MTRRFVFMAGGTGGHIFPALAVAQALRARGDQVFWLGSQHGMEQRLVPEQGIPLLSISVRGVRGTGLLRRLLAPIQILRAVWQAFFRLRAVEPDLVIGMGGFASGPGGVAARLQAVPLVIHEQNARPGMSNRLLATLSARVLQAFPSAFAQGITLGNPVRQSVVELAEPEARMAGRNGRLRLLILGGSQGAGCFNQLLPEFLASLPAEQRPEVWHQTGERQFEATQALYQGLGLSEQVRVAPFISDMAEAYGWADLVMARAGALTVSELACAGLAALLVPYPYAVDDHQTANARYLTDAGAGWLCPQAQLDLPWLGQWWAGLNRQDLLQRAQRARQLAQGQAVQAVVEQLDAVLQQTRGKA